MESLKRDYNLSKIEARIIYLYVNFNNPILGSRIQNILILNAAGRILQFCA